MPHSSRPSRGQIEIVALVFLAIFIAVSAALINYVVIYAHGERVRLAGSQALALAEAGIDEVVYQLNQNAGYTGESGTSLGAGVFTTSVASIDATTKEVTSTGYIPSATSPVSSRTVHVRLSNSSSIVSFRFGVQVGDGGAIFGNGASIDGNLYSNGNVCDSASCSGNYSGGAATVTGDVTVAAGTQTVPNQSWTTQNTGFALGDTSGHASLAQSFVPTETEPLNKLILYLKKVGSPGDISIAIVADAGGHPDTVALATGSIPASAVSTSYGFTQATLTSAPALSSGTTYWIVASAPVAVANYFTVGGDSSGGYGSGVALYSSDWTSASVPWAGAGGDADFKIYLGGVTTKIHGITIGGTAWGPSVTDNDIAGDAYYGTASENTVGGTNFPDSDPAVPAAMPISDPQIEAWENAATLVGTYTGNYTIAKDTTVILGQGNAYGVIDGDLTINGTLLLSGPVWVKGNVAGGTNATVKVDAATGNNGAQLIADVPGSEATAGLIDFSPNMTLTGNGNPGSYLMLMTTSSSGSALKVANNASTVILYAPYGTTEAKNNSTTYQITAYKLILDPNTKIIYEAGLQSQQFTSGPGGSWVFSPGTYAIRP